MNAAPAKVEQYDLDDPALCKADTTAVMAAFAAGKPLDPVVGERVRSRAKRITEEIRRVHGVIDDDTFQLLLDDDA